MKYYGVLLSACWAEAGEQSWYFVSTVLARSQHEAYKKARRSLARKFADSGRRLLFISRHGVGEPGAYDQFIGKYVGQFIDETRGR